MTIGLPLTIPNSFVRTARWFGDGEAVVDSATRLPYAELDALSPRAVALFASLGAVPGEPLALLCPPSAIYLVAWLGAVRLGALPMALHTRESAVTLTAVCRKMGARLLVYDASMEDLAVAVAAAYPQRLACVEASSALRPKRSGAFAPAAFIPGDLEADRSGVALARPAENDPAVIGLSSGATSVPKGGEHTHTGLVGEARLSV